ncbi:MAG: molybdate ABC transporter substrate-binding protein [Halopseudomonas sp.]
MLSHRQATRLTSLKNLALTTALLLLCQPVTAGQLIAAVAANFTGASKKIVERFESNSGHQVKISYGSTGKLFSQIKHGAPFEVFLAADSAHPQKAIADQLAIPGSRFSYAHGKLVLWSAQADRFSNGEDYLRQGQFKRIAIANPSTAPYGLAAQQLLIQLGIEQSLHSKLVRGESIAQAFQFTATGNAQVGLVAQSQLNHWKGDPGSQWIVPEDYYPAIDQQAVLLNKGQHNPVAVEFLKFLKGPEARRIINQYGYNLPAENDHSGTQ